MYKTIFLYLAIFFSILGLCSCMLEKKMSSSEVAAPVAAQVVFVTQPGGGSAGSVWTQQPVVQIQSASGEKITEGPDAWAAVTLTLTNGSGTLQGTATVSAIQGEALFSGLKIDVSGDKILTATKVSTSSYNKGVGSLIASSVNFVISSGAAAKLNLAMASEITPSQCVEVTITQTDSAGNAVNSASAVPLLITGYSNGLLYSDSGCVTVLSSPSLPSGASSVKVYYQNMGQESIRLTVSHGSGSLSSSSREVRVSQLVPRKFVMGYDLYDPSISANSRVTCTVYTNNSFLCRGPNGMIGTSSKVVMGSKPIVDLVIGVSHFCLLYSDGSVQCWGSNSLGQLGNGTSIASSSVPVTVSLGGAATQIVAGYNHTCALVNVSSVPTVKCWGNNSGGELGDNTMVATSNIPVTTTLSLSGGVTPVRISISPIASSAINFLKSYAILSDGTVQYWGAGTRNPAVLDGVSGIKDIFIDWTVGSNCAIMNDDTVKCWGANGYGQLGTNDTATKNTPTTVAGGLSDVTTIRMTNFSTCALKSDGTVFCWGAHGILDSNDSVIINKNLVPVPISNLKFTNIVSSSSGIYCGVVSGEDEIVCWEIVLKSYEYYWKEPYYLNTTRSYQSVVLSSSSGLYVFRDTCKSVTLSLYNSGTLKPAIQDIVVSLADRTGFGSFYLDESCSNRIENIVIPASESARNVFYKAQTTAVDPTAMILQATTSDVGTGKNSLRLTLAGSVNSLYLGDFYFNGSCTAHWVKAVDTNYNEVPISADLSVNLSLSVAPSIAEIYSDSNCTTASHSFLIPAGSSSVKYYARGNSCTGVTLTSTTVGIPQTTSTKYYEEYCGGD